MTTSADSQPTLFDNEELSTSTLSPADSRVRTLVQQVNVPELQVIVQDYGANTLGSFASYDPLTSSLRTHQHSCFDNETELSLPRSSSLTLPQSGWMRNGACYTLPMSVRRITVGVASWWPTILASEAGGGGEFADSDSVLRGTNSRQWAQHSVEIERRSEVLDEASTRITKSVMVRVIHGLSRRIHRHRWVAGIGPYQLDGEPPRLIIKVRDRDRRMHALGNAIVPQVAYPILKAIHDDLTAVERER